MVKKPTIHGEEIRRQIIEFLLFKQVIISPTTVREIGAEIGIQSVSVVQYHLNRLEREKKIERFGKHGIIKVIKE